MKRFVLCLGLLLPALALAQPFQLGDRLPAASQPAVGKTGSYRELSWDDLIPDSWNPEKELEGLDLDNLDDGDPRAQQALEKIRAVWDSAPAEKSLEGAKVKLAGFVVPLEYKGDEIREFLLVPYFGACIHVPPPPSNQIVHVKSEVGVKLDELYQPYWIEGAMQVKPSSSELADAGYQMDAQKIYMYELEE